MLNKVKKHRSRKARWAFVASVLPAQYLYLNCKKERIEKIIVNSPFLLEVYSVVKKTDPKVKVVLAPEKKFFAIVYFAIMLIVLKITKREIYFFHECCVPFFDLLVKTIRPSGCYIPQVTLNGSKEVTAEQVDDQRIVRMLKRFTLDKFFFFYEVPPVGGKNKKCLISIKQYPSTIKVSDVMERRRLPKNKNELLGNEHPSVLLLTGQSYVRENVLLDFYKNIIDNVVEHGYRCYIKDHPNPAHRLNISCHRAQNIDPALPAELLPDDYTIVAGVSSTALLSFSGHSVSFIRVIPEMPASKVNM